jgi:hypothetical protein
MSRESIFVAIHVIRLGESQGDDFVNAPIGDYFYLTHGNKGIYILGQFSGPPNVISALGKGWVDRPSRVIRAAIEVKPYTGPDKWWSANHNATFAPVADHELQLFEDSVLGAHFGIRLSEFGVSRLLLPARAGPAIIANCHARRIHGHPS